MQEPWTDEPDRVQFYYNYVPCLILRSPLGCLCGYAGVYPEHPWYKKGYNKIPMDTHGGLTYSELEDGKIRHIPKNKKEYKVWWLGFDCAHAGDLCPKYFDDPSLLHGFGDGVYRDINYVRNHVHSMADQILEAHTYSDGYFPNA